MNPSEAVQHLIQADWTEQRIAVAANTSQPTINRIKAGRQRASFEVGAALVALAEKLADDKQRAA